MRAFENTLKVKDAAPAAWPHREFSRFVTAGGMRWHVQRAGCGPAVLLIHGTGASTHTWRDVLPLLAQHYTVVAADLPGHGFSDAGHGARSSIPGMSAGLSALLGELRIEPRYYVGHSAGSVVACRMALDRSAGPRAIVSINGAFVPLGGAAQLLFSPIARLISSNSLLPRLLARRAGNVASVARMLGATGSQIGREGVELYARLVQNPAHVAGAMAMMGQWDLSGFERDLPRLTAPLALLVGENDRTVPPHQAELIARRVAGASVRRLAGLGHLAHEEQPGLLANEMLQIFARYQ
jgi:magnesium chelatase accessory protein